MATNFNADNPDQLIYENDILQLTILGGIKLEGLDRMRVTIKVQLQESSRPPVRHNLDLYNDTQLEKFIRRIAEKLEIGTSIIAASLSELTEELEKYRLEKIKEQTENLKPKVKQLTTKEEKTVKDFLLDPNLLENTDKLIEQSGVIGEVVNRQIMYLIMTKRKQEQPLHVISFGASGTGKTHLQEKISECIPQEDIINITTLSDNAFYYFGKTDLKYKVIVIEDLDGLLNALYPLRELQTKKRIVKTIVRKDSNGKTKTIHLIVEGPVCVAGCTTKEQIYEDNANRSFLLYLDESKAQDELIMEYQRRVSAGKIDTHKQREIQEFLQNVQRFLKPIRIINPFAEHLKLPQSVFKPRRTNSHYLQFIEAVTYYYQLQREKKYDTETGEEYIEVTIQDIEIANQLLKETLLRKSDELNGATRNYLELLKTYLKERKRKKGVSGSDFTGLEIRTQLRIKESTLRNYNKQLQLLGYIKRNTNKKTRSYTFELLITKDYDKLQKDIETVLDKALQKIKKK
ncbi:MAG: hypothetical protein GKR88_10245 [Flavobacteriaceae bacterium]|nr:MAG: hypothetical protein GKR88_10160 [Flavobacteriaceae bacterium]QMU64630.1 MAG: hypothetical protein GKR88_10245 [Flavobacteriaceae bacterium]